MDRIVKRIGNGGAHDCVLYKRFHNFTRHISLDADAHCDSFKTKWLRREIAGAPQRGNSDLAGDFDLKLPDRNGTAHRVCRIPIARQEPSAASRASQGVAVASSVSDDASAASPPNGGR